MSTIVHLKWGEQPPAGDRYLMIVRQGRIRGEDFYVRPSAPLSPLIVSMHAAFASLNSALQEAESVARRHDVETIYVRLG